MAATHFINRTPSVNLHGKTAFEVLYGKSPPIDHLRTSSYLCYARSLNWSNDKFSSGSQKYIFIGYPYGKKRWSLYDLELGDIIESSDAIFLRINLLILTTFHNQLLITFHLMQAWRMIVIGYLIIRHCWLLLPS